MSDNIGESTAFEYESELTAGREEIANVLEGVVDGLLTGAIRLGTGPDAVSVSVPDDLSLEVEFEDDGDESSLELELEWPTPDEAAADPVIENQSIENQPEAASEEPGLVRAADGSASLARFEVFRDSDTEWRWRLRHRNGNIIAVSGEGYTRKHNAQKGLRSVVENSPDAEITETTTD